MESYDLRKEPWIGFVRNDGTFGKAGLHHLLRNAQDVRDIVDQSPLVKLSVYRLLIAVAHWLHPVKDRDDWLTTWKAGKFTDGVTDGLLVDSRDYFDLFHPERPFCQAARAGADDKWATISNLAIEIPSGTTINHFWHAYDKKQMLCPACCAKGLVSLPPFCGQGGSGKWRSINGDPPLYILPKGANLFQTILLSLPMSRISDDVPSWVGKRNGGDIGLLEGLTWQPRRIKLADAESGLCTRCGEQGLVCRTAVFEGGRAKDDREWGDPHVPLTIAKKTERNPNPKPKSIRPNSNTSFWLVIANAVLNPSKALNLIPSESCMVEWFWAGVRGGKYNDWGSGQWCAPRILMEKECFVKQVQSAIRNLPWSQKHQKCPTIAPDFDRSTERHFARLLADVCKLPTEADRLVGDFCQYVEAAGKEYRELCGIKKPPAIALPAQNSIPSRFIDVLASLGPSDLSLLSTATGRALGNDVPVWDLFQELIRPFRKKIIFDRWAYYLIATLYPWYPQAKGRNKGKSLGLALRESASELRPKDRKRMDQRTEHLLKVQGAALDVLLLETIRDLSRMDISFCWATLLRDITRWNHKERLTQRKWALDYYTK